MRRKLLEEAAGVDPVRRSMLAGMAGLAIGPELRNLLRYRSPAKPKLRPFAAADGPAIEALLRARYVDEHPLLRQRGLALHLPRPEETVWHRTVVAESEGAIVGVGSAMAMAWHPKYFLADVSVGDASRRQGIGSALLEAVREIVRAGERRPLFAQIRPASPGARPFAARHGFSLLMRSREWRFDPDAPGVRAWIERSLAGARKFRLEEVGSTDPRFAVAVRDLYDWMHRGWNPLGAVTAAEVGAGFVPRVIPGSALLAFRGATVVGVGSLSRSRALPGMRPFLSMVGPTDPALPGAPELTARLAARCFERARRLGEGLEAEADDVHRALGAELDRIPWLERHELLQLADRA